MGFRKILFQTGQYYHIANYGIDKLIIFKDNEDHLTFLNMLKLFNRRESLGSSIKYKKEKKGDKIVEILAYAIIKNHFHLILKQNFDKGIPKFLQRLSTGYAMYYNKKHKRKGGLFVGRFKGQKVDAEELEKNIIYVNLNYRIHKMKVESFKLVKIEDLIENRYLTSQDEYLNKRKVNICNKGFILDRYSLRKYKNISESVILDILEEKEKILEF